MDLDSTHPQVYGYAKQGAAVGRLTGKKTLHPLIATACTPIARPVVAAVRLRKGKAADVREAPRFLAEALSSVRAIAPPARIVVRADAKVLHRRRGRDRGALPRACIADHRL